MKKIGCVVGRFQVPDLHEGHRALLRDVDEQCDQLIVILGIPRSRPDKRNPLDFYTRKIMIQSYFPQALVWGLSDEASDAVWSEKLDTLVGQFGGEVTLYGSRDSFLPHYTGKFKTKTVEQESLGPYVLGKNATEIRNNVEVGNCREFRRGVIYAENQRPSQVYPTVDIVVRIENLPTVLLGRKKNETLWRFPGGFVDPVDRTLEQAAARELREETGLIAHPKKLRYLGSLSVNDWRYRNGSKITTTIFGALVPSMEQPTACDDLAEVAYYTNSAIEEKLVATHKEFLSLIAVRNFLQI